MNLQRKRLKEIDYIILGIKETISSSSMEELIEALGIELKVIPADDPFLAGEHACYLATEDKEVIYLSDDCPVELETFTLAHEVGHAILHDVELAHAQQLFKSGRIEKEADYFAMRLLDIDFSPFCEESITEEDLSRIYGIKQDAIKYII